LPKKNKIRQGVGYLMGNDRNPFTNKYTPEEHEQINAIPLAYRKYIHDTLPAQLELSDDATKSCASAHQQAFEKGHWLNPS